MSFLATEFSKMRLKNILTNKFIKFKYKIDQIGDVGKMSTWRDLACTCECTHTHTNPLFFLLFSRMHGTYKSWPTLSSFSCSWSPPFLLNLNLPSNRASIFLYISCDLFTSSLLVLIASRSEVISTYQHELFQHVLS